MKEKVLFFFLFFFYIYVVENKLRENKKKKSWHVSEIRGEGSNKDNIRKIG